MSEYLDHDAFRRFPLARPLGDFHNDLMPVNRAKRVFLGYEHIHRQFLVVSDDEAEAAVRLECANDLRVFPLRDPDDRPFLPVAARFFHDLDEDRVPVHRGIRLVRRNEDIIHSFFFRHDEPEAFGMSDKPAADNVHPLRYPVAVGTGPDHVTLFLQFHQDLHKFLEFPCIRQFQFFLDLLYGKRFVAVFPHERKKPVTQFF